MHVRFVYKGYLIHKSCGLFVTTYSLNNLTVNSFSCEVLSLPGRKLEYFHWQILLFLLMFMMIHEKMCMYINNIFVAQFIFKKMLFACKIKRFQLSSKIHYIKGKCMCRLLYCIIFVAFLKYTVMECHVLVICMSIHLYACNEITVDSFKHCFR